MAEQREWKNGKPGKLVGQKLKSLLVIQYILKHADEIVDHADLKVGFTINITYENEEAPTIEISQSHIMREVMEVQFGKQKK